MTVTATPRHGNMSVAAAGNGLTARAALPSIATPTLENAVSTTFTFPPALPLPLGDFFFLFDACWGLPFFSLQLICVRSPGVCGPSTSPRI